MFDKFFALPVIKGDAFLRLLPTDKTITSILFDGGDFSSFTFENLVSAHTKSLDISIVSHADSDHIGGVIELFTTKKIGIKELWLPAHWAMLLDYISNLQTKPTPTDLRNPEKTYKCNVKENIFPEITTGTLNRVFDNLSPFSTKVINYQNHKMFMDKTTMIYNLVLLASKANTKIRWFLFDNDSDPCPKSGEWYMRPWNSKEIHAGASAAIMPLTVIYSLTITNKYSLVFHSLKSEGSGVSSIFYSADSNFKFIKNANSNKSQRTLDMPKLEERAIVTATHHGSNDEAHKPFYDYFSGSDYLYVRSDRDCCSRPTSKLKNFQTKYCTICRTSKATCCITINKSTLASSATFSPKIELEFTKCSVGWTTTQTVCCCQF